MHLEAFRDYCLKKSGATEETPFGEDTLVFKVAGKMFALAGLDEVPARANLKCDPDRALELRDRYEEVQPGYHMSKKHWNTVELEGGIREAELRAISQSGTRAAQCDYEHARRCLGCRSRCRKPSTSNRIGRQLKSGDLCFVAKVAWSGAH